MVGLIARPLILILILFVAFHLFSSKEKQERKERVDEAFSTTSKFVEFVEKKAEKWLLRKAVYVVARGLFILLALSAFSYWLYN
ncbi:hypothetical protein CL684_02690 [Candidatus Campbellbacteria bacterium]|nr:hypothetical protein [Candidatus Campbellbacteria bacterium]|tara:strand:- start:2377 stop:2628 length:252 start_codon:yes stop_codon:yes gene_type:complete